MPTVNISTSLQYLINENLTQDHIHPILLPKNHPFHFHVEPQLLLCIIRQKYLNRRCFIIKTVRNCIIQSHASSCMSNQIIVDSSAIECNLSAHFLSVVLIMPETIFCKFGNWGAKSFEYYISIFASSLIGAMHIELVTNLYTKSSLACLKRLVSRRQKPADCNLSFQKRYRYKQRV